MFLSESSQTMVCSQHTTLRICLVTGRMLWRIDKNNSPSYTDAVRRRYVNVTGTRECNTRILKDNLRIINTCVELRIDGSNSVVCRVQPVIAQHPARQRADSMLEFIVFFSQLATATSNEHRVTVIATVCSSQRCCRELWRSISQSKHMHLLIHRQSD